MLQAIARMGRQANQTKDPTVKKDPILNMKVIFSRFVRAAKYVIVLLTVFTVTWLPYFAVILRDIVLHYRDGGEAKKHFRKCFSPFRIAYKNPAFLWIEEQTRVRIRSIRIFNLYFPHIRIDFIKQD